MEKEPTSIIAREAEHEERKRAGSDRNAPMPSVGSIIPLPDEARANLEVGAPDPTVGSNIPVGRMLLEIAAL